MTDSFEMIAYEKNLLVDKLLNLQASRFGTMCASGFIHLLKMAGKVCSGMKN
jgi:hypothetical protein